ncbi:MAG: hypothetical protein IT373_13395 [Polyangiaceae bacterium]|nr:hypothetical protein [Polyangiaceae bacterium]
MRLSWLASTCALVAVASLAALGSGACSAGGDSRFGNDTGAGANGTGGGGGAIFTNTGGSGTGGGATGCSEQAKLIYVLSDANDLYSFNPPAKQFQLIGQLGCNTAMAPNSMAVDRDAVAWVNYVETDPLFGDSAGAVFKVSTANASCEPTAAVNLPSGWFRMGMGFSTNGAESTDETLFVAGIGDLGGGTGLGSIQGSSLSNIGPFGSPLTGQNAELTGTGDGRLFGFFTTTPVQVAEIDKTDGGILSSHALPTVPTPTAWAFSFWGGDFYLYTATDGTMSNVTRYRPSDQSVDTSYMTNIGFRIVGAGVSTCAPLTPPA